MLFYPKKPVRYHCRKQNRTATDHDSSVCREFGVADLVITIRSVEGHSDAQNNQYYGQQILYDLFCDLNSVARRFFLLIILYNLIAHTSLFPRFCYPVFRTLVIRQNRSPIPMTIKI